jgi:hypothetical protein
MKKHVVKVFVTPNTPPAFSAHPSVAKTYTYRSPQQKVH